MLVDPNAVIASNTSAIPIMKLAMATDRPSQVIGMHFFNPVPVMGLVEVISSLLTAEETAAKCRAFATDRLGKRVVDSGDRAGFVVNALLIPYILSAVRMLESGFASTEDIDAGMGARLQPPDGPARAVRPHRARHHHGRGRGRCTRNSASSSMHRHRCSVACATPGCSAASPAGASTPTAASGSPGVSAGTDNAEVPAGINAVSVSEWFSQNVAHAAAPLRFELIAGGRSNLTYRVHCADGDSVVLRRPPLGHVLATAHDMGREHKIITGVGLTEVPVPRTIALCDDPDVNDAPFYVMSYEEGEVLHSADRVRAGGLMPSACRSAAEWPMCWPNCTPSSLTMSAWVTSAVARTTSGRQLRRWIRQWEQSKTRELPIMDEVAAELAARKPDQIGVFDRSRRLPAREHAVRCPSK